MTLIQTYRSEYCSLRNAIHRCHSPNNKQYMDYGGRGIRVCSEWRANNGFEQFLKHIGEKPSSDLTLDRINNDGHYEPNNVRWAKRSVQQFNRRTRNTCTKISIDGRVQTIREWAHQTGIAEATIRSRINIGLQGKELILPQKRGRKTKGK